MIEGMDITCLASAHWDSKSRVNCQHIMSRLAGKNRVLYVEPLSLRMPAGGGRDLGKVLYRLSAWTKAPRKVGAGMTVYAPVMVPAHRYRVVRRLNTAIVGSALRRIQRREGFDAPLLWSFLPTGADLAGRLGERAVIYHCVDNYAANPGADREAVERLERRMLERADLVFATSRSLFEKCSALNGNTVYTPNVADSEHFSKVLSSPLEVPEELEALPPPRVGFVGNLAAYKVDIGMVAEAARRMPRVSFVFIGPVGAGDPATDPGPLLEAGNVALLGEKEYSELPAYLAGMDACMIPFRANETTRDVFPMKFFEYMACGLPVVVTGLPALAEYADYCYIAAGPGDFTVKLAAALAEDDPAARRERSALAAANSWPGRMEELSRRIMEIAGTP